MLYIFIQDAKDKGFGKKNENKQNKKMRGGKMPRGMMRMRGPSFRGMRGMPRPNMRAMMMRGRGGPFMYVFVFIFKSCNSFLTKCHYWLYLV